MRLLLIAVGRLKAGPERDLAARYAQRIGASGRGTGLSGVHVREIDESRARRAEDRRAEEAAAIGAVLADTPFITLDERGQDLTSEQFAARLSQAAESDRALAFVIGGPDGLDPGLIQRSRWSIRFGAMTLPHQLVRAILLEQLYRAITILAGHPYHRDADHRAGR